MILLIAAFVISLVMVAFMLPHVLILSLRKRLVDPIDPRKVHCVTASRLGGITFYPAIIFAVQLCIAVTTIVAPSAVGDLSIDSTVTLESLSMFLLFLIGVYDDIIGVSYRNKFLVQISAATLIIISGIYFKTLNGFCGVYEIPNYLGIPLTLLFYIFVTNAINLIDGIDGLASSLSMMALGVYTILLFSNGLVEESLITVAAMGALLTFWYGNLFGIKRGAGCKIFMGDTGALVIGALLGFVAVTIWNLSYTHHTSTPLSNVLVYTMLIVPCFDVVRIVIHRYLDNKPLFLPDKNHIHHKFIALGCTPRMSLICIVAINSIFLIVNISLSYILNITYIFIVDIVMWTTMHLAITKRIKNREPNAKTFHNVMPQHIGVVRNAAEDHLLTK